MRPFPSVDPSQPQSPIREIVYGWGRILDVSTQIAQHFDYVRIDFLSLPDRYALNEITFFPNSGFNVGAGPVIDKIIGDRLALTEISKGD